MTIREELLQIQAANNGVCSPAAVVNYARNPETLLHNRFEWNDSKAAENYRLWQARQVISLELIVIPSEKKEIETRFFVSLTDDRKNDGGYRSIVDVMEDPNLRDQLLQDAFKEFRRVKAKYGHLNELASIFDAVDQAQMQLFAVHEMAETE